MSLVPSTNVRIACSGSRVLRLYRHHAEERDLGVKVGTQVNTAVIVAEGEPLRHGWREATEVVRTP